MCISQRDITNGECLDQRAWNKELHYWPVKVNKSLVCGICLMCSSNLMAIVRIVIRKYPFTHASCDNLVHWKNPREVAGRGQSRGKLL